MSRQFLILSAVVLCAPISAQIPNGEQRVEATVTRDGIAGWESRYRGEFRSLVSGAQDQVSVDQVRQLITVIGQRATDKTRQSSDSWVTNFKSWIDTAKNGVVQEKSEYSQVETFVCGPSGYYQANEHNGGYSSEKKYVKGELLSGLDQRWRSNGWWVERQTYVGLDEVFTIRQDKSDQLLIPAYVMAAEEGRLLREFTQKNGARTNPTQETFIYTGPAPAIPGVFYPAWFGVGLATIVFKGDSESKYTVSIRDSSGGVMQELTVGGGTGEFPADIRKKIYLPYSSIVYNQVHVRLVGRDMSVADIPTFKRVAETPFAAKTVEDQRHFNFQVPVEVALQGEAAIRRLVGLDSSDGKPAERSVNPAARALEGGAAPTDANHGDAGSAASWLWFGLGAVVLAVFGGALVRLQRR
jgi:hypothetical protein